MVVVFNKLGEEPFFCLVAEVGGQMLPEAIPPVKGEGGSAEGEEVKMHREEVKTF